MRHFFNVYARVLTILYIPISYFCSMSYFNRGSGPQTQPIVKNLIIINVLMVLAQTALATKNIDLGEYLGLHYWQSPKFRWWQIFTHMFMHGSANDIGLTVQHIFFNMFGLWMFGNMLERIWGPKRFLLFYLVCGLGAALCHMGVLTFEFNRLFNELQVYQQHPGYNEFAAFLSKHGLQMGDTILDHTEEMQKLLTIKDTPQFINETIDIIHRYYLSALNTNMVGASGAVFGILFGFAYLFPNTELYIMFIPIPVKAKWAVTGYAAIELFSGIGAVKGDNIAHFAHLGGMLFAFILLSIWKRTNRNDFY